MTDDPTQIIAEMRTEGVAWCNEATYAALLDVVEAARAYIAEHDGRRTLYAGPVSVARAELRAALSALAKTRTP